MCRICKPVGVRFAQPLLRCGLAETLQLFEVYGNVTFPRLWPRWRVQNVGGSRVLPILHTGSELMISTSCMSEHHDDVKATYCHPAALHRGFHLEADRKEAEAADQDTESASLTFTTF